MKIQLENWLIEKLSFEKCDYEKETDSFSLKTDQIFISDNEHSFKIIFTVSIDDKKFNLDFEMHFNFKTGSRIDEKFKTSDFPKINAPAIAFPYVRAFISNFTLQSGYNPIMLPSINFVQLANKK